MGGWSFAPACLPNPRPTHDPLLPCSNPRESSSSVSDVQVDSTRTESQGGPNLAKGCPQGTDSVLCCRSDLECTALEDGLGLPQAGHWLGSLCSWDHAPSSSHSIPVSPSCLLIFPPLPLSCFVHILHLRMDFSSFGNLQPMLYQEGSKTELR